MSRATSHLVSLQRDQGEWEGEVVWCTMILSQYVIVRHVTQRPLADALRRQIIHHYEVTRTSDGGWPLHREGPTQVFATTLAYVALRMLGLAAEDALTRRAREWLQRQPGGVLGIPTWGKFWLSILDLYGADGVATFPPELFLLPEWVPGHPRTWYCHTRYIYLGMSYLSGRKFRATLGPLRDVLRRELYAEPYDTVNFSAHRHYVAPGDLYATPTFLLRTLRRLAPVLQRLVPTRVHDNALRRCFSKILSEQRATRFQALSPVNGLLNCLAIHATDALHPELEPSIAGLETWRWCDNERGLRFAGARSHVWDTAFATRALLQSYAANPAASTAARLHGAHAYLKQSQLFDELPSDADDRERIRGGWCFSDGTHRWPVSDCTAEALTAILDVERTPGIVQPIERLPEAQVRLAVDFVLRRQNGDGGFSTYEPIRAGTWLDRLNPAEMFRDCMTERSYVECTASAVEALATVRTVYPVLMSDAIGQALERAIAFLRRNQRADGAFPSAWGVNFTYSVFHVAKGLRAAGVSGSDPALARAAEWLRATQRFDGGWGEHFSGCLAATYVEHSHSQAVMTSWALLALADIDPACDAIGRGIAWLQSTQLPDGSWPHEAVNGVFFGTAMLEYALYVSYFPAWAVARYMSMASPSSDAPPVVSRGRNAADPLPPQGFDGPGRKLNASL